MSWPSPLKLFGCFFSNYRRNTDAIFFYDYFQHFLPLLKVKGAYKGLYNIEEQTEGMTHVTSPWTKCHSKVVIIHGTCAYGKT